MGDNGVVRRLYSDGFASVLAFVLKNSGSKEAAEDLYHEAFLASWRNVQLKRFTPANESEWNAYLNRVARNKWIDQLRAKKGKETTTIDDDRMEGDSETDHDQIAEEEIYIKQIVQSFRLLGEDCQRLLNLFYYKRKSMREIATLFKWTEGTARNNKYRCLQKLKTIINKNRP